MFSADTSAWTRSDGPRVKATWTKAIIGSQIATYPIVALELLRGARDAADFDAMNETLSTLREIPVTRTVTNAASPPTASSRTGSRCSTGRSSSPTC